MNKSKFLKKIYLRIKYRKVYKKLGKNKKFIY